MTRCHTILATVTSDQARVGSHHTRVPQGLLSAGTGQTPDPALQKFTDGGLFNQGIPSHGEQNPRGKPSFSCHRGKPPPSTGFSRSEPMPVLQMPQDLGKRPSAQWPLVPNPSLVITTGDIFSLTFLFRKLVFDSP